MADTLSGVEYDVENNEMLFYYILDSGLEYYLKIDEIDGTYDWMVTFRGNVVGGILLANEFTENTKSIPVSYYDSNDEEYRRVLEESFSWYCTEKLLLEVDEMLLSIGLSIEDLGFTNFYCN